nr:hypothetical protein [uncultured organism]
MTSKMPPVPQDNRSPKGTGEDPTTHTADPHFKAQDNPDKIGQQGNSKVNTTNQGYQQDR